MWEIRADGISGCLRTAKGGSGKQAVVEAGQGNARVRWMTPTEYARLQGAPNFRLDGARRNDAISAFGDGVCVPVIAWIARKYLTPLLEDSIADVVPNKTLTLTYSLP
jgi:DNA (cytosine-5)-methyltransferase 1